MPPRPAEERASRVAKRSPRYRKEAQALGRRIRTLREGRDLTIEAAAERMQMAPAHLQKIEVGLINLTLVSLVRIVEGLDATLSDLFPTPELREARR